MAGIQGMSNPKDINQGINETDLETLYDEMTQASPAPAQPPVETVSRHSQPVQQSAAPIGISDADLEALYDQTISTQAEFTTETPSIIEQVRDLPNRLKASFQITDKELVQSLEQSYGKQNVRMVDGAIQYKLGDKWRVFDAGFEPVSDIADLTRMAVEEIPTELGTLGGASLGLPQMMTGVGIPSGVAAIAAGRSLGAVVGQGLADLMQTATGVERDPERSVALEYGVTAVLAPLLGAGGDYFAAKLAKSKKVADTLEMLAPEDLYKTEVNAAKEALEKIKEFGGMENIHGTDTPVMLAHMNPSNPIAHAIHQDVAASKVFSQMSAQVADNFDKSMKGFIDSVAKIPDMGTGQRFKDFAEKAIRVEGESIGSIRDDLVKAAGNRSLGVPNLKNKVNEFAKTIGLDGTTDASDLINYLADEGGYSKEAATTIIRKTEKLINSVESGSMSAADLMGKYTELNSLYRNLSKRGETVQDKLYLSKIGELRRFVADELADKVDVFQGDLAKKVYTDKLAKFSEMRGAMDEFSSLLERNKVASHSLSKAIFNKGKDGLDSLKAAKVLTQDNPQLMDEVKGAWLSEVIAKHPQGIAGTNWNAVMKEVRGIGDEMLTEAFGPKHVEGLKAFETVGKMLAEGDVAIKHPQDKVKLVKAMALAQKSILMAGTSIESLYRQLDVEGALQAAVTKEGIDNFLKTAPKAEKALLRQALTPLIYTTEGVNFIAPRILRRKGKDASKDQAEMQE